MHTRNGMLEDLSWLLLSKVDKRLVPLMKFALNTEPRFIVTDPRALHLLSQLFHWKRGCC